MKKGKVGGLIATTTVILLCTTYIRYYWQYQDPTGVWSWFNLQDYEFKPLNLTEHDDSEIVILRWTRYFGSYSYKSPMILRKGEKCLKWIGTETLKIDCRLSYDRRYLGRSNAVVFHLWDILNGEYMDKTMPPHNPDQIWIMQNHESPDNPNLRHTRSFREFDWTMTYRQDSDFHDPYGLVKVAEITDYNYEHLRHSSANKTKLAAWIVSHCETPGKREDFVKELRKYIPVDIYGQCGTHTCRSQHGGCYADVAQQYKFYLSFENSLCVDYVTEKFFNALAQNLVPVVYGGANYSKIAPPGSFINARDFKSPRKLADYLKHLDNNLDEYLTYFSWKRTHKVASGLGNWCGLCQKIYNELLSRKNYTTGLDGTRQRKWYENIADWWNHQIVSGKKVSACEKSAF